MNISPKLRKELLSHIQDKINDEVVTDDNFEDLHFHCSNEDYYIVYHSCAIQWLEDHDISAFEAIGEVIQWEQDTLGEVSLKVEDINPEKIVNLYVYVAGEQLINELGAGSLDELKEILVNEGY